MSHMQFNRIEPDEPASETSHDMSDAPETLDNAPEAIRRAVRQLSFAYSRSEEDLSTSKTEVMTEALRRAEAVLFTAGEAIAAEDLAETLPPSVDAAEVLMALRSHYHGRGVELVEVGGRWRFQSAPDLSFLFVETRQETKKLSQAALETLAIIAYGQPVTRAEIEAVRGVAVSKGTLDTLMEAGWVRIKGRRKTPGRPVTLGTTDAFLEHFGLESLSVLPGKADLEAEGLLSDVVPEDFESLDDGGGDSEPAEAEAQFDTEDASQDGAFVTDFMGPTEPGQGRH
ncbi:MAG: SMC-Scp complex subunit ScpB [Pseudomonadota bacterium]